MDLYYTPLIFPLFASLSLAVLLGLFALKQSAPAARSFAWLMLALSVWTICYIFELSSVGLPAKSFWVKAKYIGSAPAPILWFIFSVRMTNNEHWLSRFFRVSLAVWVTFILALVFSNNYHHWFWTDFRLLPGVDAAKTTQAFAFWIYAISTYMFIAVSGVLYFNFYRTAPPFFHAQGLLLVLGGVLPLAGRMLKDVFKVELFPNLDEVIFLFLGSAVFFALALFKYGAMNLIPIAHSLVIENIGTGIIVVDQAGRIIELNPFAQRIFEVSRITAVGKPMEEFLSGWSNLGPHAEIWRAVTNAGENGNLYLSVFRSEIRQQGNVLSGHILVFADITTRKHAEFALERVARTDALTGITNRHHFFQLAIAECERATQDKGSVSVMMLDLDHFKQINDSYGHQAGDLVLRKIAQLCKDSLRPIDIFARYGGEEFIALLVETDESTSLATAEKIRREVGATLIQFNDQAIPVTISIGLTHSNKVQNILIENLIAQADQALYLAKNNGRNQTVAYSA